MTRRALLRRVSQGGIVGLLALLPVLSVFKLDVIKGTLCSIGTAAFVVSCPLGVAQILLATRTFDPWLALSGFFYVAVAFVLGRAFCGWVCPQGTLSEIGDRLRTRLGYRRVPDSPLAVRRSRMIGFSILGVVLATSFVVGVPLFCYICPIGLISRALVSGTIFGTVGGELAILGLIITAEISVARRGWCKYICPMGALYGACVTPRSLRVERNAEACQGCHTCEQVCPTGNSPIEDRVGSSCLSCGDCLDSCPEEAISFRLG